MPGSTVLEELELIIDDLGGGGGKLPPRDEGGDGGDGDGGRSRRRAPSSRRYSIAIGLAMISILVFFVTLAVAFLILEHRSSAWVPVQLPRILWANTVILLASSVTLEWSRRSLADTNLARFQALWRVTTALGILFLVGQVIAWRQLIVSHVFISRSQATSFFYLFTGAHGLHLLGGIAALLYVSLRKFERAKISRRTASQVTSYYWHFMDGLWVVLFALMNLGK